MAERKLIIAIDGPSGAGKSTLASRLARKFGYLNIETGAMYRALALKALQNDVAFEDAPALEHLAHQTAIVLEAMHTGNRVLLDGKNVTERIREQDITDAASKVSVHPGVRSWMVGLQRKMGEAGGVVMEGRDIGTAVFPNAEVKIFLDADPDVRGNRRYAQKEGGMRERPSEVAAEMKERDARDRTRAASPLIPADDAVIIDSTRLTLDEVVAKAVELVTQKQK
jgi:cytidylate kinase